MPTTLRVLTYNLRQLRDDREAVLAVLRGAAPDVVAVQEPPRGPLGLVRLRRLAARAGLEVAVGGGGARTTALLVRPGLPVGRARAVRLPRRSRTRRGLTRRGLAVADVAGVRVVSVHLSLDGAERAHHVHRLLLLVAATQGPCVVAGDLNEPPGGRSWRSLGLHLRDVTPATGPTYPTAAPVHRIDAVHATGVVATGAQVVPGEAVRRASDHLPVVVDLTTHGSA